MRKIRYICLLLVIVCALCACQEMAEEQHESTAPETQTAEPTQESVETAPTETVPEETPAPTEQPATEKARELIQNGDYQAALELLETEEDEEAAVLRLRAGLGDVSVGDQVILGRFEQDNDTENGAEEIEWIVLERDGDKALLLSLFCLDTQPYFNVADVPVTWAESTLRAWLNGEFCNAAFSETEKLLLEETELVNSDNPTYGTPGGENTPDRVFLLSLEEAESYLTDELRLAPVSQYAAGRGCYDNASGNGWWWLRSPGVYGRDAAYISAVGKVSVYGYIVHRSGWAVRPAIWIYLSV